MNDEEERRKFIRREVDREVCPFHELKCEAIRKNAKDIESAISKMATKEDLKEIMKELRNMKEDIREKAPRWALILFMTACVAIFGILATLSWNVLNRAGDELSEVKDEVSDVKRGVTILSTNQEVLLKAFYLKPKSFPEEEKGEEK